jgi:hypothetical protein
VVILGEEIRLSALIVEITKNKDANRYFI